MKSKDWSRIYANIVERQRAVAQQRGMKHGSSPGIAVMDDPLALEWQYLENLASRVGCRFCEARDIERGIRKAVRSPMPPAIGRPPHTRRP